MGRRIEMKRWKLAVVISLVVAVGLVGGLAGWLALRPVPPVTVVVSNSSGKAIAAVRLEHERGVEIVENLARGETRTIKFTAGGETSYTLRVRFADGSEVSGSPQYAESGYAFIATVSDSGIKTDEILLSRY